MNLPMSPLRRRHCFLVLGFVLFVPFCFFVLFSVPEAEFRTLLNPFREYSSLFLLCSVFYCNKMFLLKTFLPIILVVIISIMHDVKSTPVAKPKADPQFQTGFGEGGFGGAFGNGGGAFGNRGGAFGNGGGAFGNGGGAFGNRGGAFGNRGGAFGNGGGAFGNGGGAFGNRGGAFGKRGGAFGNGGGAFGEGFDVSSEQFLMQRIAELQVKLQYLDSMYRTRQEDLRRLTEHIDLISIPPSAGENTTSFISSTTLELSPEVKQLIKNMSGMAAAQGINPPVSLRMPSSYHFLPHLLDDPSSLRLAYLLSKGRAGVSMVLGVPTVKREKQSYLMDTLQNLIDGMTIEEANDSLIVVFIAETDLEYVLQVAKEVEFRFPTYVEAGLIEVISPSASYYPDFDKLRLTLGDSPERVRWRSKQNLDFAYLMSYAQPKGTFYVQLEDDILAKPQYVTEMKNFAIEKTSKKEAWFVLDFCQLGFIGKMFKSAELPWLITFFQMFYNDKPVDWLLDHLLYTKVCNYEKNNDVCKREKAKKWIHYKPSLFQHIGTHSSLKGKVQKLKDKQFGKVPLFFPHSNPEAEVTSAIKHYKQYTLKRAYLGETFFWGLLPQPGDQLTFRFNTPISVKSYLFKSGNAEHPSDKFYNTTVEVLPLDMPSSPVITLVSNITNDGYIIVGKFDSAGIAKGTVDGSLGKIQALRLHVHSDSENWAILSEIHIQDELASR